MAQDSVFSMFGGGAKKEKKEDDEDNDNSGSAKAMKDKAAEDGDVCDIMPVQSVSQC